MITLLCMIIGYLIGGIPTGYLVARAHGVDIQKVGSGNIGATNVLRSVGKIPALFVLVADPLKGVLTVMLALGLGLGPWGVALTGLATVLGNNYNIYLRLKGGKGIATSLGVFIPIQPAETLAALAIALFTMYTGRYVSLGSLVGLVSTPLFVFIGRGHPASLALSSALAVLAVIRHRQNLERLAAGNERRLGEKRDA